MKTVTGVVIGAESISLPKAATLLSSFVSAENGASQAVDAYLRRASAAFSELKSLHVELKSSPLKATQISYDVTLKRKKRKSEEALVDEVTELENENEMYSQEKKR